MKMNLLFILLFSVINIHASVEMDFENHKIGNWTVSGGSISLVDNKSLSPENNKYVLQAIAEKETMVLKTPWYKAEVTPEEYIEFDYCLKIRDDIKYIAFAAILENEAKPLWLPQSLIPESTPGQWRRFSMQFKEFKLKKRDRFRCFVVQIALKNQNDPVCFLIDNFKICKMPRKMGCIGGEQRQKNAINDFIDAKPLVAVKQCKNIEVDGRLSEKEWKDSAQIVLLDNTQNRNLVDKSRIKISHDADRIYLAGILGQSYLNPRKNLMGEIEIKVKQNDGRVWTDDSVELFLASGTGDIHQYVVNMDGFLYDARNRDRNFKSKALIATSKDENNWYLEMAIPKKELNITAHDRIIKCNIFRNNPAKEEVSAWNPTRGFFAQPQFFGSLELTDDKEVVTCLDGEYHKSDFLFEFKNFDMNRLSVTGGEPWTASGEKLNVALKPNQLGFGQIIIARNQNILFRSPAVKLNNNQEKLNFAISSEEDILFDLWVNDRKVTEGKSRIASNLPLDRNLNLLVLKVINKYGAAVRLKDDIFYQGLRLSIENFIYVPNYTAGQKKLNYNQQPFFKNHKFKEKEFYLICRFVKNSIRFAPQLQNGTFHMMNQLPQKIAFRLTSPVEDTVVNYQLNLQLPKEITIPRYEHKNRIYNYYTSEMSCRTGEWNTFSFSFRKPVPRLNYNWGNCITMVAVPNFQKIENRKIGKVWSSAKALYELPQNFFIRVGKQPVISSISNKKKIFVTVDFRDQILTTNELVQMLPAWRKIGINLIGNIYRDDKEDTHKHLINVCKKNQIDVVAFLYAPRFIGFTDIMEQETQGEAFSALGRTQNWNRRFCPLYFMKSEAVKQRLEKLAVESDAVLQDVESGVKSSCFCPACLKFFAENNHIGIPVSAEVIQKKYMKQWEKHVVQVNFLLCRYIFGVMKNRNHKLYSMVYSGFHQSPISLYGMDWHFYKNACDFPMAGYSESSERISSLRKILCGQKMIPGILLDSHVWKHSYASQNIEARLWNLFIAGGCVGVNIWNWYDLDGRGFEAIHSFARAVGQYENFLDEQNLTTDFLLPSNCYLFKRGNQYLFAGLNFGAAEREFVFSLPGHLQFKNLSIGRYSPNQVRGRILPEKALLFTFEIQ